jgi:hypothetical protein
MENKIRSLRQFLSGWAKILMGLIKRQELIRKAKAETQLLSQQE